MVFRVLRLLSVFVVVSALMGVLIGGLVLPYVASLGNGISTGAGLLSSTSTPVVDPVLPQTSVMTASNGSVIASFYQENRTEVPLTAISLRLQQAVVAIEDARFYSHGAVDARGVVRAIVNNSTGGDTQGASTITQQYVKNAELEAASAAGDRAAARAAVADTLERKVQDIKLASAVEKNLSKQQILERYLNIVFFGDQTYGAQAAAERYFGVPASHLTIPQAATLAGMVQNPVGFEPLQHRKAAQARRDIVLQDMLDQKMITPAQYSKSVASKLRVTGRPPRNGCANAASSDGFFCQYVVQTILTGAGWSALGKTQPARMASLQRAGLVIRTTLDAKAQQGAQKAVDKRIPRRDASGLATSAVTVEPGTGRVIAMAQDRTFSVTGGRGRTSVNYGVDHDLGGGGGFQTGSSFKPFTLSAWLQAGHSLNSVVDATQRGFAPSAFTSCGSRLRGTKTYSPGNSEGTEKGKMSVESATINSVNVAFVAMETKLDLCDIADTAESLGVHRATNQPECVQKGSGPSALPVCEPALTLGIVNIAPLTMASAYAGFASGGTYCTPVPVASVTRIKDDGQTRAKVSVPVSQCRTALDPAIAHDVSHALRQVLTKGTAAHVGPLHPWPSAGKTGTTNGPKDTWFVGYTAQRSTAVWVGDPNGGPGDPRVTLRNVLINGHFYNGAVFGATIAAPIWKDLMNVAMKGLPAEPLP